MLNQLLNERREEIAQKLIELARQVHFGRNTDCFIVGDFLISLTAGPITDLETLNDTQKTDPNAS